MKHSILFLLIILSALQSVSKEKEKRISVLPVPAIGYSPETKTYVGAVTLFTFKNLTDTLTRTSNAEIEFNYTWNKQVILESRWNYFFPKERWFSRGMIHYSKYPDLYYGLGAGTTENEEANFQSNRLRFEAELLRNMGRNLFLGGGIRYVDYTNISYLKEQVTYPELQNKKTTGISVSLLNENRNNILSPSQGSFFEFNNTFNFGSNFYVKTNIDFRKYYSLKNKHIFAGRIFHSSIFGTPPFFDYAMVGGDAYTRGYYLGRFRDKNFSTLQFEYRTNLFWRIGVATFGGISAIYNNFKNFDNNNIKPNGGLGLRFLFDKEENTMLRLDYAIGANNQSGFYISFGESF